MHSLNVSNLNRQLLDHDDRYVYVIRADVKGDMPSTPRVCERDMAISISMATNPATEIPNNIELVVTADDGSYFPDLKTAIAEIKKQLKSQNISEYSFMLGDDARRFLQALHVIGQYKETFNSIEVAKAAQHLVSSSQEDVLTELETSGRDVIEYGENGYISIDWGNALRYIDVSVK